MKTIKSIKQFLLLKNSQKSQQYIPENISTSYPIKETNEPLVFILSLFQKEKITITYSPPNDIKIMTIPLQLRKTAAEILVNASKKLPKGYCFKVSEGYRPLEYQKKIFNQVIFDLKKKNPNYTDKQLWLETTKYVADPKLCPPHTTGGAIDLTILDENKKELDMGNPMNTVSDSSNTFTKNINKKQKENRLLLFESLTNQGFVNLPSEWWHYSYGDQYWAIFKNKKCAIYDKI